jgi:hypothetical protein
MPAATSVARALVALTLGLLAVAAWRANFATFSGVSPRDRAAIEGAADYVTARAACPRVDPVTYIAVKRDQRAAI